MSAAADNDVENTGLGGSENPSVDLVDLVDLPSQAPNIPHNSGDLAGDIGLVSPASSKSRFGRFPGVNWSIAGSEAAVDGTTGDDQTAAVEPEANTDVGSPVANVVPESLRLLSLVGTDNDPYKEGGPWSYAEDTGGRVFFITQNETYTDGRPLMSEQQIAQGVNKKGMTRWAWGKHDKDVIGKEEVTKNPALVLGAPKANHFHVAAECKSHATLGQVARAYGVPPSQVEVKPRGSFLDLVEYLTHEHPNQVAQGKHVYLDDEIHANFDWRTEVEDHKLARSFKAGQRKNTKKLEELMLAVMHGVKSLRQVREEEPVIYGRNIENFKRWRADFLLSQDPPRMRTNHYIGGKVGETDLGRTGKTQLARLLARALYPHLDAAECYHEATDKRVPLQNYRGQPVIIWDDYGPVDLMEALGGRTGVWQVFDDHPGVDDVNIKYGSVRLVHEVNIITRVTPYREYLDGLAGEYTDRLGERHHAEDKRQAYGRFPFVHEVTVDEIGVFVNRAFIADTREFYEFEKFATMRANLGRIGAALDRIQGDEEREAARIEIGDRLLAPVLQKHQGLQPVADLNKDDALALVMPDLEVLTGDALAARELTQAREFELEMQILAAKSWGPDAAAHFTALHLAGADTPNPEQLSVYALRDGSGIYCSLCGRATTETPDPPSGGLVHHNERKR